MSTSAALLKEIVAFCDEADIAPSTFSRKAVNDGKLVERLRSGASITVATAERVRAYIAAEREHLGKPDCPQPTRSPNPSVEKRRAA